MTNHPARTRMLDGVHNFRDYGGYAVSGGGHVVHGKLWRSGQHFGASEADLDHIESLELAAIVDLRGPKERAKAPNPALPRSQPRVFETEQDTANLMLKVNPVMRVEGSLAEVDAAMCAGYKVMPFNPALIEIMREHFHALAKVDGAQLVHCLAGKDRTGLAVALTHHMLGVHHDDMMADYLLTNSAGNIEARIAAGVKAIRAAHRDSLPEDAMRVIMSVRDEYLDIAFAEIRAQHGSINTYMHDVLEVDDAQADRIRTRFIVN